ncbi:hypothetical protein [Candidatus Tisiphia endosymbiont of Hybos culiciformis]|uniref:hypothetical protein n=1 Tax=Candidatus Tisiphia endosymbiont of Hybos culiciformis TaxID=3139331 RepID=UPI003CCB135A
MSKNPSGSWKDDKEWQEIKGSLASVSCKKFEQEQARKQAEEQAKKQVEKDNNDQQAHYVTEIIYDNPSLNKLFKGSAKSGVYLKDLITTALTSVQSLAQSDSAEYAMPMGDINDDTSEG